MQPANPDEYYVWAALHASMGLMVFIAAGTSFAGLGVISLVGLELMALLTFLASRFISQRTHHTYCMVIAGISCFGIPLGTALGLFTIMDAAEACRASDVLSFAAPHRIDL